MIVNIFYPSGTIRVFGKEQSGSRAWNPSAICPKERGLYRQMNVQQLLEFYGELRGGKKVSAEVTEWLQKTLTWPTARPMGSQETLSKGMSQKVQFIATVVPEPKLLILDEPFTGLDPVSADAIPKLGPRSAPPRIHRDSQHSRHECRRKHVDYIFMIFKGNESAGWRPRHDCRINMEMTPFAFRPKPASARCRVCRA